ncbi:MAG: fibronectin type III domain-containing protein [Cyclobacteriaceae bacterium]|nr:fibronectin type III domain-containing protein [Cyclobacteriaceae bacterium]
MTKQFLTIISALFLFGLQCRSQDKEKKTSSTEPFETAEVYFEQNATDGDAEVVFKATAGDNGLTKLLVIAPDGRTVIDFEVPDQSTMGIRSFQLESPEPEDIEAVKKAYPSGVYKFSGTTTDGTAYFNEATLKHTLPSAVAIQHPANEAEDVSTKGLEITWSPIEGVEAYLIEVEQEDSDVKIEATLLSSETSFLVPEKFLLPDTEYKVVVGSVSEDGNLNFVELAFSTATK